MLTTSLAKVTTLVRVFMTVVVAVKLETVVVEMAGTFVDTGAPKAPVLPQLLPFLVSVTVTVET